MAQSVQRLNRISRFNNNRQLFAAEAPESQQRIHSPFTIQSLGQETEIANLDFRDGVLSRRFPIAGNVFQRNLAPNHNLDNCSDAIKSTDISQISSPQSNKSWNTLRTPHFGRQAPSLFSSPTSSAGRAESESSLQDFHDIAAEEGFKGEGLKIPRILLIPTLLLCAGIILFLSEKSSFSDSNNFPTGGSIILMVLGGLSCFVVSYHLQKLKKKKQLAQGVYSETVDLLTKSKKACLKQLVFHFEEKYGKEVVTKAWPLVEALRVSSGKVLVFKDAFQGSYEVFWSI